MSRVILTLLRHAKSSWRNQGQRDQDRPLNDRGNRDAPTMAHRLISRNSIPDVILCSAATRTRQTTDHLLTAFGEHKMPHVQYLESLYLASATSLLDALNEIPTQASHVMLAAHNPGIETLSARIQGIKYDTMPTCAIRQFSCASFSELANMMTGDTAASSAELIYSDSPRQTDKN